MKKILSVILILILNTPLLPFFNSSLAYDNKDISALQNIYNHNVTALNHWDLSVPGNIDEIEWECTDNTYKLISLDLGNTDISGKINLSVFDSIEYYNFACTNLNEIVLPNDLDFIPQDSFAECSNLEYINIPQSVNSIGKGSFKNCSNLKSVVLNNSNTSISSEAFSGCISLECIINANDISSIGRNAFSNCNKLIFYDNTEASIYIDNYTQNMNYTFSNDTNSNAVGYASIMTNGKEQSSYGYPYKMGIAYLYDENNNLIEQMNLDTNGQFSFSNLLIGHKYKLVIDGEFAIARSHSFIATKENYGINTKEEALPVITCDFNKDGIITNSDVQILFSKCASCKPDEVDLYNLDNDKYITVSDAGVIYSIMAYFNEIEYLN